MKQEEMIKQMTDRQLVLNVYLTQALVLGAALLLGLFVFGSPHEFIALWHANPKEIFLYGGGTALLVVGVDSVVTYLLPERYLDDGGINERIFRSISIVEIFFLTILIAFAEEVLFRGIIQTSVGIYVASIVFAVMHIRYIKKVVLFTLVVSISFVLGFLFEKTGNLAVTFFAHFLIDFVLGIGIRIQHRNKNRGGNDDGEPEE